MATTTAVLNAERWLDEVILQASLPADVAGAPLSEIVVLPDGLGDVAIMSVLVRATGIDSVPATLTNLGVEVLVFNIDGTTQIDHVGAAQWNYVSDTATSHRFTAYIDPDALVLWRQEELLTITSVELDDDATPTGEVVVVIKAVRVRPMSGTARAEAEFRLVR